MHYILTNIYHTVIKLLFTSIIIIITPYIAKSWNWDNDTIPNSKFAAMAGINERTMFALDIAAIEAFTMNKRQKANLGYSLTFSRTAYQEFEEIDYACHNIYGEYNYFVLKGIFIGGRIGLNFNWVSEDSKAAYEEYLSERPLLLDTPTSFIGYSAAINAGIVYPVSPKVAIKVQGQIGTQLTNVTPGGVDIADLLFLRVTRSDYNIGFINLYGITAGIVLDIK
ncbi:MAG: hypothetical protein Kapaf2KO_00250 [Candidatus Kapaibacteriales bacterium]